MKLSFFRKHVKLFCLSRSPKRQVAGVMVYNDIAKLTDKRRADVLYERVGNAIRLLRSYAPQALRDINGIVFDHIPGRVTKFDGDLKIAYISVAVLIKGTPIDVAMIIVTHTSAVRLKRKGVSATAANVDRVNQVIQNRVTAFLRRVPHATNAHYENARKLSLFRIVTPEQHLRGQRRELEARGLPKWVLRWLDKRLEKAERAIERRRISRSVQK